MGWQKWPHVCMLMYVHRTHASLMLGVCRAKLTFDELAVIAATAIGAAFVARSVPAFSALCMQSTPCWMLGCLTAHASCSTLVASPWPSLEKINRCSSSSMRDRLQARSHLRLLFTFARMQRPCKSSQSCLPSATCVKMNDSKSQSASMKLRLRTCALGLAELCDSNWCPLYLASMHTNVGVPT